MPPRSCDQSKELHALLDFLIDGPGPDKDKDALRALVAVGRIMERARWAIDHEARRILAGVERSPVSAVLVDDRLPKDARRELAKDYGDFCSQTTVQEWEKAVGTEGTATEKRALLRIVLTALAQGAGDGRLEEFAHALCALDQGEALPLLRPSRPVAGIGRGAPAQVIRHRLRAVLGIEYLCREGRFRSASTARKAVAGLYGVDPGAMKKWPDSLKRVMGAKRFEQERAMAATSGLVILLAKEAGWSLPEGFVDRGERMFGLAALKLDGEQFKKLRSGAKR